MCLQLKCCDNNKKTKRCIEHILLIAATIVCARFEYDELLEMSQSKWALHLHMNMSVSIDSETIISCFQNTFLYTLNNILSTLTIEKIMQDKWFSQLLVLFTNGKRHLNEEYIQENALWYITKLSLKICHHCWKLGTNVK